MKKVLIVATVVKTHIMHFHIPYLKWLKENNCEVHVCARNDYENKVECNIPFCDKFYDIPFERNPFHYKNILAYRQLKKIIDENNFDVIHCHTPVGGVLTRLASIDSRKNGTYVIYTAHGFHFYKGAPLKNWILFFPIEKLLSKHTDCIITINDEDFNYAIRKRFKANNIYKINGVGIDFNKFNVQIKKQYKQIRKKYGFNDDDFILIYVAELSYRKNQYMLIDIINQLKYKIPNIRVLIVGTGKLLEKYKNKVEKLNLSDYIIFLGYRKDVPQLMALSDIVVSTSRQEGLPVNLMEAMAIGMPLVVTDCRGNRDLVKNNENGYIVAINDIDGFASSIEKLYKSKDLRQKFGEKSLEYVKEYSIDNIVLEMSKIYNEALNNNR